ncbi:nitrilase/cyanide hydratase and apolipoprotein N-acyltransferase [Lachnospiraceae bacterium KM106-2]|nr:nitrilase/cyanide hydratase and apolipoprotein N-acyltransferase [Lachnospiraceae bacterium KM106-2]
MRVAAVHLDTKFADVSYNLTQAEKAIKEAKEDRVELLVFPEFFTTGFALDGAMLKAITASSHTLEWMKKMSKRSNIVLCGSYLCYYPKENKILNTFSIVMPDGTCYHHSKDIPTAIESLYYEKGDQISVFETSIGRIGVAMCWEQIRYQTVRRMIGKVDFVVAGSCWWNFCKEDGGKYYKAFHKKNQLMAEEAPEQFARLLGVPVIHASHAGGFMGKSMGRPKQTCKREILGFTEIVDESGNVLVRYEKETKPYVLVDIPLISLKSRKQKIPKFRYWIPDMPWGLKVGFYLSNHNSHKWYCQNTLKKVSKKQ